jgi:AraC family transcriptional regulator
VPQPPSYVSSITAQHVEGLSMSLHATNTVPRAPGNRDAPPYATVSRSLAHEWHGEPCSHDRGHKPHDRTKLGALDAVVQITPSEVVRRRGLTCHGMAAETAYVTEHCRIESRFRGPVHLLVLFEEGARKDGSTFVEGVPRSALRDYRRKLIFVPSGHEYYDWQEPSSLTRAAYFYFDPAALPVESDLGSADVSFVPRLFFEDAGLWDTAIKLRVLIENSQENDRLYCESLGVVLAHELVRLNRGAPRVEPLVRGGLAGWQQRAVAGYIEEHFAEQISLVTLAQLARLSPYHFSRAFKQSFGMPPHRFHTRRRIEHAKLLLAKPAASVTSVGFAIGFSETSSFSAAFRRTTGLTPTDYQRSAT